MRYESEKKPKKCPACGSSKIASYLYGMPAYSEKLQKQINEGMIILTGCIETDDDLECNVFLVKLIFTKEYKSACARLKTASRPRG